MKKKNQKGFSNLLIIAIVLVIATAGVLMFKPQTSKTVPATENSSVLNSSSTELDSTNVDSMDTGINQINTDSSSF